MNKWIVLTAAVTLAAGFAAIEGCSPSTELGGVAIINALPETRITGAPPVLTEAGIVVEFFWTGNDPDGNLRGFEWKISNNGEDGISVQDTLTVDPATGDTLHPWFFTQATDSVFIVTADSSGYIGDQYLPDNQQRFYQTHTFLVRSIDDKGGVDPTPAMISFTSTTITPFIQVDYPDRLKDYAFFRTLPSNFTIGWTGRDDDFETEEPTKVRYLLKEAWLETPSGGQWVTNEYDFQQNKEELLSFSEPGWSDWVAYESLPEDRRIMFSKPVGDPLDPSYYFFAIQAQDTAGAVSVNLDYASTVHNFRIGANLAPGLMVTEQFLPPLLAPTRTEDIAQNQPLEFHWFADADEYGGIIEGYRFGWDVADPDDDLDPGWEIQWGNSDAHRETGLKTFNTGSHTLTVEVKDNSGAVTRKQYTVQVVPVKNYNERDPVLLIDDVLDHDSQGWENSSDIPMDQDTHRDAFWTSVLGEMGGWDPVNHVLDTTVDAAWGYREVVDFKVLLWTAKIGSQNYIRQNFVPYDGAFVWLDTYVSDIGNLFMVGEGALTNFTPTSYDGTLWLYPIIYDTDEVQGTCGSQTYALGMGTYTDEDENTVLRGREVFPYASMGLSMLNHMVPATFWRGPNLCGDGNFDLARRCGGTKGIILDRDFRNQYIGSAAFPDTIFTWDEIDHEDEMAIVFPYDFGGIDEFYDDNVTTRATNWSPQIDPATGEPYVVPMWRAYSRYDWILDIHLAQGDSDFPGDIDLTEQGACGAWTIDPGTGRTKMDGAPLGMITFKSAETKPLYKADVIWGFDPHRLDHQKMRQAIRWVLETHFGLDY